MTMSTNDINKLVQRLHDDGVSIIETMKTVRETLGVNLGVAKQIVTQHPAWQEVVEAHIPFHEELIRAIETEGNQDLPEPSALSWPQSISSPLFTREDLESGNSPLPQSGLWCEQCRQWIPQFPDLSEEQEEAIRRLAEERPFLAMKALREETGCSLVYAKVWVSHKGVPEPIIPCPFCGKSLRTSKARQCRHCKRDWHDSGQIIQGEI